MQPPLPLAVTLSELESHLWGAANILRGSPVDRTDWKSYILPLLFFKRVCDVYDEEYAEVVQAYGEVFAGEHRFQIPEGCHWNDVRGASRNVGAALVAAMRGVEAANQKHLYGVFGDAQWTNKERLPGETIDDPACGTLLAAVSHVRDHDGDPRTFFGKLFGSRRMPTLCVTLRRIRLHGNRHRFRPRRGIRLADQLYLGEAAQVPDLAERGLAPRKQPVCL